MGDVEKKSLHDSGGSRALTSCGGFQLHCFPDITNSEFNSRRACSPDRAYFQRAAPGSERCPCGTLEQAAELEQEGDRLTAEEAEQVGYQRGYCDGEQKGAADGEKTGFMKGRQSVQPVIEALGDALKELARIRERTYRSIEPEVVKLSLNIARKIVGRELSTSPEIVSEVIRRALDQLESAERICIKLNPQDLKTLEQAGSGLWDDLCRSDTVAFEGQASIENGGCLIEADTGNIDARLETQFQAIEEMFSTVMSNGGGEG